MQERINRFWQRVTSAKALDKLPHSLTHQRLYIIPTQRGFAFLLALLLMLIASVNYALSLGYALSFLLTGLFSATLLHTYSNVSGLVISKISVKNAFAGEKATVSITLRNDHSKPRHGICISAQGATFNNLSITGQAESTIQISIPVSTRGRHPLGRLTIRSNWPLGLWVCWSYVHDATTCLVYPSIEHDAPTSPVSPGDENSGLLARGWQGDVSGLREYIPGDTLGSIAWKSVAKLGELQVRTFEDTSVSSLTRFDLTNTGKTLLEDQLSRLCAWVLQAEAKQIPYELRIGGTTITRKPDENRQIDALSALALYDARL